LQVPPSPIQRFKTVLDKPLLGIKFLGNWEKEVSADEILETLRDKCGGMKEERYFCAGEDAEEG
jgi:hypothetical protein